ncbi:MAG: glycine betaine ABC transporter substrate-binding protein [Clostridia bacterium]
MNKKRWIPWLLAVLLVFILCLSAACGEKKEDDTSAASQSTTYNGNGKINIATKNTAEQNILANLAKILIREKMGIEADIVYYEDSTSAALLEKMDKNDIQIFFDYSGSLAVNALEMNLESANVPTLILDVQNTIRKKHSITVSEEIGYNSTTAVYMTFDRREELGSPATLSNLAQLSPKLKIGMSEAFYTRIDCYEALCELYEMNFKEAAVYEEEAGFAALVSGEIDVYIGDSVTPYFSLLNVKQLVDDKYFFLPQNTCYLVSDKAMKDYPELDSTLSNLEGLISASRMSLMIKRIYWEGHDIEDYLFTYLRANNII